jgi:spore coat protein U-like protein
MKTLLRMASALALAAFSATPGHAASPATSSFTVSITINPECKIISASSISFGTLTFITGNVDIDSSIIVQCTITTPYNIGLGAGTGTNATVTNRLMTGPAGALLPYALYRDAAHTQNWGVTTGAGGDTQAGVGSGANQTYTVYGRVAAQSAAPGAYTDSIVVTLSY